MNSPWLQHGLELLAARDFPGVEAWLAAIGADAADREKLAGSLAMAHADTTRAVQHFAAALALKPDDVPAFCGLGLALQAQGRMREALTNYQRAAALAPDHVDALVGQGECSFALGDFEDARDCFEVARAHGAGSLRAQCGLARLLRACGDFDGAIRILQDARQHAVPSADILFELALSLNHAGDTDGARSNYEQALAVDSQHLGALVNLGLVYLTQLGDPARAGKLFEAACSAHPYSVAAQANLGLALQEQGRFDLAIAHYDKLVSREPDTIEYRWNRALAYLHLGDYERGWPDYELRHVRGGRDVRRDFGLPVWDGSDPANHRLLVYGEQGLGDEIMFASCLPDLLGCAASVVLECDARLAPVFARSFPALRVHGAARDGKTDWLRQYPALDRQLAIGSLPRLLRRHREAFPLQAGYLLPDASRVAVWRERLAVNGGAPAVGLSWRGGTRKTRAGLRSLELSDFSALAAMQIQTVCLQRGDCGDEIAAARAAGFNLHWWPDALNDIEETAALIAALDCVISVDNTVAHLAGSLGVHCWTLLAHTPDWRYGTTGISTPWYPAMRLMRQTASRNWPLVVAAVANELHVFRRPQAPDHA